MFERSDADQKYYEAVGPIPKYNAGPVWKDPSQEEGYDMTEAQITEHQNKVSRHRETVGRIPIHSGEGLMSSGSDHLRLLDIGQLDSQILKTSRNRTGKRMIW